MLAGKARVAGFWNARATLNPSTTSRIQPKAPPFDPASAARPQRADGLQGPSDACDHRAVDPVGHRSGHHDEQGHRHELDEADEAEVELAAGEVEHQLEQGGLLAEERGGGQEGGCEERPHRPVGQQVPRRGRVEGVVGHGGGSYPRRARNPVVLGP
jgi:hypothetical protein